jgi:hypothetical protein
MRPGPRRSTICAPWLDLERPEHLLLSVVASMKVSALRVVWTVVVLVAVMAPPAARAGSKTYDLGVLLNRPHPLADGAGGTAEPAPPPSLARLPRPHAPPANALAVFGGWLTDNNFEEVFVPWELDFRSSGVVGLAGARRLGGYGKHLDFESEGQVVRHIGKQDHWEFNLPFVTRWKTFPWDDKIDTSVAFGIGPSYATEVPNQEVAMDGDSQQWLVYWVMEAAMGPPRSDWEGLFRLHHRSGAFGVVADDGGSNILTLGVRRRF